MTNQSTIASIQNIRKQKQLDLELIELERKWHVELKIIARERLSLVKELCRINRNQRNLDHYQASLRGKDLTKFADNAQGRLRQVYDDKKVHKYNFEPDPVEKMNLHLPLVHDDTSVQLTGKGGGQNSHSHSKHHSSRRVSGGLGFLNEGDDIGKVLTVMDLKKKRVQMMKSNYEHCTADRRNRRRPFWDKALLGTKKKQEKRDRNGFSRAMAFGGLPDISGNGSSSSWNGSPYASALMYFNGSLSEGSDQDSSGSLRVIAASDGNDHNGAEILFSAEPFPQHKGESGKAEEERDELQEDANDKNMLEDGKTDIVNNTLPGLIKGARNHPPSLPSIPSVRPLPDGALPTRYPKTVHPSLSKRRSASLDYLPVLKGHNKEMLTSQKTATKSSQSSCTSWTLPTISET